MEHPHVPDWFLQLYERRGELTAGEFYMEFWMLLQNTHNVREKDIGGPGGEH